MITDKQREAAKRKFEEEFLTTKKIQEQVEYCQSQIDRKQGHYPNWDDEMVILLLKEILRLRQREIDTNSDIQRLKGMLYIQRNRNV
ncbi:MAG: hypothetical protein ACTSW7_00885 [Candidatus Thorarchaeota archaeon]|nr:hypothetical protein [Thermoplasmatales archaeon]